MLDREEIAETLLRGRLSLIAFYGVITHDHHAAEDVYQDVCVKAFAGKMDLEFESIDKLLSWARVTGRNRAIDLVKARDGRYVGLSPQLLDVLAASWKGRTDHPNLGRSALKECLERLTARSREIVRLRYFDGLRSGDVARAMAVDVNTFYRALTRIHRQLANCVRGKVRRLEGEA